ncbi:MAG: hypothetical protein IH626_02775 [Rhodospirillales bacterium]|nr:hypothetical protein [Rhodospirillales bacterium]
MTHGVAISRKEFFRRLIRPAEGLAAPSAPAGTRGEDLPPAGLWSDFPPALLNEEAARLGLDPASTDQDTLLRTVYRRMQQQRTDAGPADGPSP